MDFELITGGAGSGKSSYVEDKIEECISSGMRAAVIVPERFSHMEEATLCRRFGGLGVNSVEVTSFSKLAQRLAPHGEYLQRSGRQMLVMKAAKKNEDAGDGIFLSAAGSAGFVDNAARAISEFKHCLIEPDALCAFDGEDILSRKMRAIGAIYSDFNAMLGKGLADPDEDMALLAAQLEEEGGFYDTRFFIDGFSDFLPSHYAVISALIKRAAGVSVVLTLNDGALRDPGGLFAPPARSAARLEAIARDLGARISHRHLPGEFSYIKAPDIKYFLKNYDEYTPGGQVPACENISVTRISDRQAEVEWVAGRIMHEVRENGRRFRDIAVMAGDGGAYESIIDAVFPECGIPYFTDRSKPASAHPIIRLVSSVFGVIEQNFSQNAVFEYLRSGLIYRENSDGSVTGILPQSLDKLELFVSSRGIRGKKKWLSEEAWQDKKGGIFDEVTNKGREFGSVEELDALRRELMMPFVHFLEKIGGRRRVRELCEGLVGFLREINLYRGLMLEQKRFEEKNMLGEAARLSEVWEVLCGALDQCVLTSGEEFVSREDFVRLLETGLSKCKLDSVPPGSDMVAVGSASESRPVRVKVLFIIGAVRGELPAEGADFGLITAADRAALSERGFDALPDEQSRRAIDEFNIYSTLTTACERLYISLFDADDEGAPSVYPHTVAELLRTFPELSARRADMREDMENMLISRGRTKLRRSVRLAKDISPEERSFWSGLPAEADRQPDAECAQPAPEDGDFSIFENDADEGDCDLRLLAQRYLKCAAGISPQTAQRLYGNRLLSITGLQTYNKCPFEYFISNGLGVYPEREYKLQSYDLGDLVHWAVCEVCREVQKGAEDLDKARELWEQLDDERRAAAVGAVMDRAAELSGKANPDYSTGRLTLLNEKTKKRVFEAVGSIRESILASAFSACEFELPFNLEIEDERVNTALRGVIDRLDMCRTEDGVKLRVIDYKTGAKKFSVADIYNKTDFQLIVYALAAADMYKNDGAKVASVLYNSLREDTKLAKPGEPAHFEVGSYDGVIVTDGEPQEASGEELRIFDAALSEKSNKSAYLSASTTAKGILSKNSCAVSREKFGLLEKYVKKAVADTHSAILAGEITPLPAKSGSSLHCAYCGYSGICLHDEYRNAVRELSGSDGAAWEKIGKEDGADE